MSCIDIIVVTAVGPHREGAVSRLMKRQSYGEISKDLDLRKRHWSSFLCSQISSITGNSILKAQLPLSLCQICCCYGIRHTNPKRIKNPLLKNNLRLIISRMTFSRSELTNYPLSSTRLSIPRWKLTQLFPSLLKQVERLINITTSFLLGEKHGCLAQKKARLRLAEAESIKGCFKPSQSSTRKFFCSLPFLLGLSDPLVNRAA